MRADIFDVATTNLAATDLASTARDPQSASIAIAPIGGRVIIVDQQAMIAESLALVLQLAEVTTSIIRDSSLEAVLRQVRAFDPDLVLVSANGGDAPDTVRTLSRAAAKVVVVTDGTDRIRVASCIEAGATGAVATSDPIDSLLNAVRETVAGRRLLSPTTERDLLGELQMHRRDNTMRLIKFQNLSNRESEVLWALMMGRAASEIAEESYVSIATIRSQIKAILRKLEVNSQLAAVALAYQAGWSRESFRSGTGQPRILTRTVRCQGARCQGVPYRTVPSAWSGPVRSGLVRSALLARSAKPISHELRGPHGPILGDDRELHVVLPFAVDL